MFRNFVLKNGVYIYENQIGVSFNQSWIKTKI